MKKSYNLFLFFFIVCGMARYFTFDQTGYKTASIILLIFVLLLIGNFLISPAKTPANLLPINNRPIAIVFDLHGVVFRFSPLKALQDAITTNHKKILLKAALHPFLIWDVIKLLYTNAVVEAAIMAIAHKYPSLKDLIPLALKMANEQIPIEPTVKLITQLKNNGFKILVFSNIGEQSALILQQKYPHIFALFDGVLVTSAQDNYLMKPSEQAFTKFLTKFNLTNDQVIFIDDKKSNIDAARKLKIFAIEFMNPHQCQQLLEKHQII